MGKLKTVWRVTRQTLLVLLITAVLAELALRFFNYVRPTFVFYDNTYNRFRGKPNSPDFDFHLNSKGFKDVEFKTEKEADTYRIVALGDSFAFGVVPYKHNYLTLLEEDLTQNGKKTEVINMGIVGTGPKDYLALLVNEGLTLKPDLVLVSFFVGNDFFIEHQDRKLYSYSYLASFINYLFTLKAGYEGEVLFPNKDYDDQASTFTDAKFVQIESDRSEIYRKQNKQFETDLSDALNNLVQIKQQCDSHGIALTVVLIPDEVQVNRSVQTRVLEVKAFNSKPEDFDFTLPNQKLMASLKDNGIDSIDLLDPFSSSGSQTVLYKPRDTHWNIAGNKLAEELIAAYLLRGPEAAPDTVGTTSYEGFQDETDCQSIKGWAWDLNRPNDSVRAEIYDGEKLIATVTANVFRKDLFDAKKGTGAHAFQYSVPSELKDGKTHSVSVRLAGQKKGLTGSPKEIRCEQK
jgi:hypothetical protein